MYFKKKIKLRFVSLFCLFFISSFVSVNCFLPNAYGIQYFSDIKEEDYFFYPIKELQYKGIVKGYPNGEFRPYNNITVSEALAVLFRIAGIQYENPNNDNTTSWDFDIMEKARSLGVISSKVTSDKLVTRLDIGRYVVAIYNLDTSKTFVSEVFEDTNSKIANTMYEYGVFVGVPTETGVEYRPKSNISRADLCVVLNRLDKYMRSPYSGTFNINGVTVSSNPTSYEDFVKIINTLGIQNNYSISIPYNLNLMDADIYNKLRTNCLYAYEYNFSTFPEKYAFTPKINIKRQVTSNKKFNLVITLSHDMYSNEDLYNCISKFNSKTSDIITNLTLDGRLLDNQSDLEKAKVLFEYVVVNTKYDVNTNPIADSFTGYGAAINNIAVCQGYVALFNNLCRSAGLEVEGISGVIIDSSEEHIWSRIKIDDIWHYFDVTYADPIPNIDGYCDFTYFDINYEDLMVDRILDSIYSR